MAHFAKLTENTNEVLTVLTIENSMILDENGVEQEALGQAHLEKHHGWPANLWKQTSYNTDKGVHKLGGTPFRKNYAGRGMVYDAGRDAFLPPPCDYASWTLNETTCQYECPEPRPVEEDAARGSNYEWDENTVSWKKIVITP